MLQGVSDTPAWVVSAANTYAKDHGKTPFVIYQGAWSVLDREIEREILPMCRQFGLAIAPWNVLQSGKIRTDEEEERRRHTGEAGKDDFYEPSTSQNASPDYHVHRTYDDWSKLGT